MSGNLELKTKLSKFSDMQQKAFKYLFDPSIKGDLRKAMTAAGYSKDADTYEIFGPMRDLIIEASKDFLMFNTMKAAQNLVDVMEKPNELGNGIRLKAIEQLLDRAGVVKTERVEHTGTVQAVIVLPPKEPVVLESEPVDEITLVEAKEMQWKNPANDN